MRLEFTCKCNHNPADINDIVIKTHNDTKLHLDREHTEIIRDGDLCYCEWRNVYIWDGSNEILLPNDLQPEGWILDEVILDDDSDTPADITCTICGMTVNDVAIQIN